MFCEGVMSKVVASPESKGLDNLIKKKTDWFNFFLVGFWLKSDDEEPLVCGNSSTAR